MQQLASSLLAASAQSVASFESPPAPEQQQNYSASNLMDSNNAALAESAFYSNPTLYNYFLNAQQYYPSDSSSAYTLSPAALEQYTAAFLSQTGNGSTGTTVGKQAIINQNNKMTGGNKQGLGRRIGELVSNSAERASRAFKSFSHFKLFNDIKPSRLLGLVSDQQQQQSADGKPLNASQLVASASSPVSSAWYFPPSSQVAAGIPVPNPWSSAYSAGVGSGSASPSFYQQPVFVRTQEVNSGQTAAAASAPMTSHMNGFLSAQKGADYLASMSEFYPQKLSSLESSGAAPFAPNPSNMALGGSTTVYHHYGPSSAANGNGQSQPSSDLFAAPQTQFGVRMKPPKDFDFDASNEDEMSNGSSEQDDAKMADSGSGNGGGPNGGRNNLDNGGGSDGSSSNGDRFNERPSNGGGSEGQNGGGGNRPWLNGPSSSSFDEYSDSNSAVEPDLYNAYNPNVPNNGQRFRPFNTGHSAIRPPNAFHSVPNLRPYLSAIRRPSSPLAHSAAEFDDTDSWYNTFFGTNVKPMTRLRGVPFANSAPMAAYGSGQHAHHHHQHPSTTRLLNSASTVTPTSLSPDNYFGNAAASMHSAHHHHSHSPHNAYFQATYNRPVWPGYNPAALYSPGASNAMLSPYFRPQTQFMAGAATQLRPVTMPYNPYFMAPRFHQGRPAMYSHAYPAAAYAQPTATPMMMAARYASAYPMMSSASTLYPVRVPFTPMMSMANPFAMGSSLMATIAQPPVMRYRIGTDLTPRPAASSPAVSTIRRTLNITKRGQLAPTNGLDLVDTASSMLSKVGKAIANTLPSVKASLSLGAGAASPKNDEPEIIVPNEHEANLATLYNAYQVLQRRMESTDSPASSKSEDVSSSSQQQQQAPPPYYHYYIGGKDIQSTTSSTTTSTTTTNSPLSTLTSFGGLSSSEHLDSSDRAIPLNFSSNNSSSSAARSIKARHISDQLAEHEKRQEEIRKFLDGGVNSTTTTTVPSPTFTVLTTNNNNNSPGIIRTAKSVSSNSLPQILPAGDSSPWRPLFRSAVVNRKHY